MSKKPDHQPIAQAQRKAQAQRQQLIAMGVVGVMVGLFFVIFMVVLSRASAGVTIGKYDRVYQAITANGSAMMGDPTTPLMVAEFADFGCPFCLSYQPTINTLVDQYVRNGQIQLIFVAQMFHQNSQIASQAALCAAKQKKFWEMHDVLYDIQSKQGTDGFTIDNIRRNAEAAFSLDSKPWFDCIASGETQSVLNSAGQFYQSLHLNGTPTLMWSGDAGDHWQFFLADNQQPYTEGGVPLAVIARTIDAYYQATPTASKS